MIDAPGLWSDSVTSEHTDAGLIDIIARDVRVRIDGIEIVQQPSSDADTNGRWRSTFET